MDGAGADGRLAQAPRITPDFGSGAFHIEQPLTQNRPGYTLHLTLSDDKGTVCGGDEPRRSRLRAPPDAALSRRAASARGRSRTRICTTSPSNCATRRARSWIRRAVTRACAASRSTARKVKINGETIFQRLVLDQGYYPDGVLTAPTDDALIRDITLSQEAGFNGARLHQKVFEERFLYHADRLGYLVWGEFADWGVSNYGPSHEHQQPGITYVAQWLEALERDYSHPAIIGWCALNETWQSLHDRFTPLDDATRALFLAAKAMDTSRPVLDASGYSHRVPETDVYDSHYYIEEKNFAEGLEKFRKYFSPDTDEFAYSNPSVPNPTETNPHPRRTPFSFPYGGQPYWLSEFGGFKWNEASGVKIQIGDEKNPQASWGYGSDPTSLEDFYHRFEATCHILIDNASMFGYCYTQLTDVYPEENGIYTFSRSDKFDSARLRAIQERVAAIEQSA